jgi:hypothetical protein
MYAKRTDSQCTLCGGLPRECARLVRVYIYALAPRRHGLMARAGDAKGDDLIACVCKQSFDAIRAGWRRRCRRSSGPDNSRREGEGATQIRI